MAKVFWSILSKIRNLFLTAERLESKQTGRICQFTNAWKEKSGGKPTFPTSRLFNSPTNFALKAAQSKSAMQDRSAQGEEGGLAPALLPGAFCLLPFVYCPGAVFVSVPENPRFFISASVRGSRPRKLRYASAGSTVLPTEKMYLRSRSATL